MPAMAIKSARKGVWRLLRLAVLWARRGSAVHSLRLLKTLRRSGRNDRPLRYGEREFSIDETPAFRFRTPSARVLRFMPCIAPAVPDTPGPGVYGDNSYFFCGACDRDADCAGYYYDDEPIECGGESHDGGADEQLLARAMMEESCWNVGAGAEEISEDAAVDMKAEEFIAKFHAQMRLQQQISWLQYNEMLERSLC